MISYNFLPRFSRAVTDVTSSRRSVCVLVLSPMIISLTFASGSFGFQFPPVVDLADTTADVTVMGASDLDRTGFGVTSGDYDGDGVNDLAVLSSGDWTVASIAIFWGRSPLGSTIDLLTYQGDFSKVLAPAGAHGFLSARIASGDFNGDGYDDLALGLREASPAVYLIFGSASFPPLLDLSNPSSPVTTVLRTTGDSWFGDALAVGNLNGDSCADLIIGAPASSPGGRVYVIYGRAIFPPTIQLGQIQPGITRIFEPYSDQRTGTGLACKDVDKDGFDDVLIGSPGSAGYDQGLVTLLFGSSALPDTITLWDSTVEAMGMKRFWGEYSHGHLGWRVGVGDLQDDGIEELVLSADVADPLGCDNCGEIYVVSWNPSLPDSVNVGTTIWPMKRLIGSGTLTVYGEELVVADVSGDGRDDVLISRNPDLGDPLDVRDVTVVYGSASLPDSIFLGTDTLVTRFLDAARGDGLGRGLGVGDVNSDGNNDVLLGAYAASPLGRTVAGKAYVFYGTADPSGVGAVSARNSTLWQNYPNPFNPTTTISFSIREPTDVLLEIFDVRGALVRTLVDAVKQPSMYKIPWDGRDNSGHEVASGVYFYRLTAGKFLAAKKLVLLR